MKAYLEILVIRQPASKQKQYVNWQLRMLQGSSASLRSALEHFSYVVNAYAHGTIADNHFSTCDVDKAAEHTIAHLNRLYMSHMDRSSIAAAYPQCCSLLGMLSAPFALQNMLLTSVQECVLSEFLQRSGRT